MTYQPGNSGYPPAQQPSQYGNQYAGPTQPYNRLPEQIPAAPAAPAGPSKLPEYLTTAVAALGLLIFGFNFAPQLGAGGLDAGTGSILTQAPIVVAVLAALLAGVSLLPKQKSFKSWVAILAVLALLLVINEIVQAPKGIEVEWGLYVVLALSVLQAGSAVAALLLDAGVIQPPAPRPQADPYSYGGPARATTRRLSTTASSLSSSTASRPASISVSRVATSRSPRMVPSVATPVRRARRSTAPTRVRRPRRPVSPRSASRSLPPDSPLLRSCRPIRARRRRKPAPARRHTPRRPVFRARRDPTRSRRRPSSSPRLRSNPVRLRHNR